MTNITITINDKKHTIEMNKTTAKRACKYGTEEYKALQEVRSAYPNYRIETVIRKVEKCEYKGLTFEYMKQYIEQHDDANKSKMEEFLNLRAESEEAKEKNAEAKSYAEIKNWFLKAFPAIEEFASKMDSLVRVAA